MNSFSKKVMRNAAALLCLSLPLLSAGSCGGNGDRESTGGSTLTILHPGSERLLHGGGNMSGHLLYFLPLTQITAEGDFEGALAERWEHSEDFREWTYYLRTNIRWHDGVPFTAHDIAFSLDLLKHPDVLVISPALSYTVIDDYTIRIRAPWSDFNPDWWRANFPKHILQNLDPKEFWEWDFWLQPVGNGPYRYVRHVPATMVELEANPDYFRGKPKLDKVIIKFGGSSIVELLSGDVQIATYLDRDDLPKLESDGRFDFYSEWGGKGTAIFWNHKNQFLGDPRVRKALTLALDRSGLFEALSVPDSGLYPVDVIYTDRQWKRGEIPEGLPHDPEAAKRLLAEAGFSDSDNDGILDRGGEPFLFTALLGRGGGPLEYAAVIAQSAFRQIGVKMDISYLPAAILRPRVWQGDFDATFNRASEAAVSNLQIFGPDSLLGPDYRGWIGIHHIPISSLLTEAAQATNPEQQDAIYRELWEVSRQRFLSPISLPVCLPMWLTSEFMA